MTQSMRRHWLGDSRLLHVLAEDFPGAHAGEWLPARIEKEDAFAFALLERRPKLTQVNGNRCNRATTNRDQALLGAFAEDAHKVILHHHVAYAERDPLGDSQSRTVRQLEHGPVSECERLIKRRSGEKLFNLFNSEHFGKRAPALGGLEPFARVTHHVSFSDEKLEVGSHRRHVAPDRCRGKSEVFQVVHVFAKHSRTDVRRG